MLVIGFRHLPLSKHHARDDTKYPGTRPDKSFKFREYVTEQGHPTAIFGKYLFGRRFEI